MERMQKVFEDLLTELKKMGASEEQANKFADGLTEELFFSLAGFNTNSDKMKKVIVRDARQKAVLYLRAISITGIEKFDPKNNRYEGVLENEEVFDSFSDVNWDYEDE